jgi:hypothetical protein
MSLWTYVTLVIKENKKITKYENIVIKKGIKAWSILKYEKFNEFHNNFHFEAHFLFQI